MAGRFHEVRQAAGSFARAFIAESGRAFPGAVVLVAAGAVLEGASILLLLPILDVVVSGDGGMVGRWLSAVGVGGTAGRLALLLGAFVAVMIVRAAVLYRRDMALARLQLRFVNGLRNRVMRALAGAPWSRVVGLRHARVANLMSGEMQRVAASAQYLINGSVSLAMIVVQAVLAFVLAPWIALGVGVTLLIGGVLLLRAGSGVRDMGGELIRASQALMNSAAGFLGGLKAAAAENGQARFVDEFAVMQDELSRHSLRFVARQARSRLGFGLGSALAATLVVLAGVASGLAPGVLITLILVFARMSGPAVMLQTAAQSFFFGLPSYEAARALELELGDSAAPTIAAQEPPEGPVALANVRYLHAGGGGVADATLTIAPGEFLGIAGPSGAGKTTLIDLLTGLLVPQAGTLSVGGVVLDDAGRAGWRSRIGYVAQDGFLFHDSVRRNLEWGGNVDPAALAEALAVTGADSVIAGLDDGLDTIVGERGARLSGGERQRIAIARALLRRPRLLILDEATNAIDVAGERALLERLTPLSPRPIIVMIAHRADSLALCSRIITVQDGTIVS